MDAVRIRQRKLSERGKSSWAFAFIWEQVVPTVATTIMGLPDKNAYTSDCRHNNKNRLFTSPNPTPVNFNTQPAMCSKSVAVLFIVVCTDG